MFKTKTVLVVGAGASFEAGMPVGTTLAEKISEAALAISGRAGNRASTRLADLREAVNHHTPSGDREAMRKAAFKIASGIHTAGSIDAFIDRHDSDPHVARLGKALIATEILHAEHESKMARAFRGGTLDLNTLNGTWYSPFSNLLFTGYRVSDLSDFAANLSIVCFNYDRCIEYYLLHALMLAFSLDHSTAHRVMSMVDIIHPYGHIGALPKGQHSYISEGIVPFGADESWINPNPFEFSANIRTFTEQEHDHDRQDRIHSAIASARRLIFLGFSFQPQNIELMAIPDEMRQTSPIKQIIATGKGISDEEVDAVSSAAVRLYRVRGEESFALDRVSVHPDVTCSQLFERYRLVLLDR